MPRWSCVEMKPGCCFMKAASEAQASWSWSASSGSTVKVLISTTEPTCSPICSKRDTCLSISTSLGNYPPYLNAWCELRSPSQQIGKGQTGTAEPIVEPDAEIVQRHPRCQTSSQPIKLMRALSPQTEDVEELVVDTFDDLAYSGHPSPQAFGPAPL